MRNNSLNRCCVLISFHIIETAGGRVPSRVNRSSFLFLYLFIFSRPRPIHTHAIGNRSAVLCAARDSGWAIFIFSFSAQPAAAAAQQRVFENWGKSFRRLRFFSLQRIYIYIYTQNRYALHSPRHCADMCNLYGPFFSEGGGLFRRGVTSLVRLYISLYDKTRVLLSIPPLLFCWAFADQSIRKAGRGGCRRIRMQTSK